MQQQQQYAPYTVINPVPAANDPVKKAKIEQINTMKEILAKAGRKGAPAQSS